jgi:FOG: GAF domain
MKIKAITFALTAVVLIALASVVLWRYHVEVEPIIAASGESAGHVSSAFQIIVLIATMTAGLLILFFMEKFVFQPVAKAGRTLSAVLSHGGEELAPDNFRFAMYEDLSRDMALLDEDIRRKDVILKDREAHLTHRLRVEEALAKVSRYLLRNHENGIARSLRLLGRNLNTDIVSYWELTGDDSMHCLGTFRGINTGDFSGEYDFIAPAASWIIEASGQENPLIIDDVENIPEELQAAKQFIGEYDLKSFLGVPLRVPVAGLGGMVAFGNIKEVRHWSKEDLRALEVVAELLADRIGRRDRQGGAK